MENVLVERRHRVALLPVPPPGHVVFVGALIGLSVMAIITRSRRFHALFRELLAGLGAGVDVGFVYIWRYDVNPGAEREFEELYGPDGGWARFFAGSPSYRGADLLRRGETRHYVTVDRWSDEAAHSAFVAANRVEFERLDGSGRDLTRAEELIGKFDVVGPTPGSE